MLGKFDKLNMIVRQIAILLGIAALVFATCLCATGIEPFDMHFHTPTEGFVQDTITPEQQKAVNEAKEKIDNGTATEKDYDIYTDYLMDVMVDNNNSGGTSGNNEGTFSTDHTSPEHG